jgi:hypothetical protein
LLPVSADAEGHDVIAESYLPGAPIHNAENIGLEPVWPYDLIGDDSPMFELARRTYEHRPYVGVADWSFDPVQAARLGLGDEVRSTLLRVTERSQHSINGFANWDKRYGEFYVEQVGVVADALQEALVQDYDGLIRLAQQRRLGGTSTEASMCVERPVSIFRCERGASPPLSSRPARRSFSGFETHGRARQWMWFPAVPWRRP